MPTMLTHMVAFMYRSRFHRWRDKPYFTAVVNSTTIPHELGVNKTWTGFMIYDEKTLEGGQRVNFILA